MITFCIHHHHEFRIEWEAVTALATAVLALFTIGLVIAGVIQLLDIKKFIKQNEQLNHIQSAENIIMKQLEFHHQITGKIEGNRQNAFKFMYDVLSSLYLFGSNKPPTVDEQIRSSYSKLYSDYGYQLGHYYRNLYRIFKNIDEIKIDGFDKKYWAKLVRAQLSEYEVLLLFYNCIWVGDENKFKDLVERYELLEGINYEKLYEREHYKLYLDTAFGKDLS